MVKVIAVVGILVTSCAGTGHRQDVHLAPNAPEDRSVRLVDTEPNQALTKWRNLVAPHVEKAMASYPEAKRRYLAGLPARYTFFVTTLIRDRQGHFESVFVVVDQISAQRVTGRIANQVNLVRGYRNRDSLTFPETEVIDWTISRPDGSEEGNFVGKFLDSLAERK
jgi:hypothetical protein